MSGDPFRRRADRARAVPLEAVLLARGAVRDRHDRSKWHTEQGPLSMTGAKFINMMPALMQKGSELALPALRSCEFTMSLKLASNSSDGVHSSVTRPA